ncbi:MAG: hypothetical protein H7A39_06590 [Chlamydiales bacterium]|nr:hypothetical protein [Chlamydiales bacterium]
MPSLRAELKELTAATLSHVRELSLDTTSIFTYDPPPKIPTPPPEKIQVKKPDPIPKSEPAAAQPKIELQPIIPQATLPTTDMKSLIAALGIPIIDEPPSDSRAKRIKNAWKQRQVNVAILVDKVEGPVRTLLLNIARAIDTLIAPCKVITTTRHEQENTWDIFLASDELKHIIAPDTILTGNLLKHLHELPEQNKRTLGNKPLILLPDLTLYLKDPLLKASLWKTLCVLLSRSS